MSISRTLRLKVKLEGHEVVLNTIKGMQQEALKLQAILSNVFSGKSTGGAVTPLSGNLLAVNMSAPIDNAIKQVKDKTVVLKQEVAKLYDPKFMRDAGIYSQGVKEVNPLAQYVNTARIANYKNANVDSLISDLGNYASKMPDYFRDLKPYPRKQIPYPMADLVEKNTLQTKISKEALDLATKDVEHYYNKVAEFDKRWATMSIERQNQVSENLKVDLKDQSRMYQNYFDDAEKLYKKDAENRINIQKEADNYLKAGFGLHIVQMYLAPLAAAVRMYCTQMLQDYAEFDKKFTDYMVKSEDYGEYLSKGQFYETVIGQTFGLQDAASTAERFAASGIDVAQSQTALTSVMQVATIAHMDYTDAANGVIRTMQAMHMSVQQTTEITDALINSANASTAELQDLVQWFEYAASAAYQADISIQHLAAYLGILSSTGTPNTGAAMRQLLIQLADTKIQEQLMGKFSFIDEEDFFHFDTLIGKLRNYVQASKDQAKASREVTETLGGKANAMQAMLNLLVAEPGLWNQVNNAVDKTGSTTDLYNKITKNAADQIERIRVNLNVLWTQAGQVIAPVLGVVAKVTEVVASIVTALPEPVKWLIGFIVIAIAILGTLLIALLGITGALAIMTANIIFLRVEGVKFDLSLKNMVMTLRTMTMELINASRSSATFATSMSIASFNTKTLTERVKILWASFTGWNAILTGASVAMIGYMETTSLMHEQMYSEAKLLAWVTGGWIALSIARAAAGNPAAAIAGAAIGFGYVAYMNAQIDDMARNERLNAQAAQTGYMKANGNGGKTYNVNIQNATISDDGMALDDFTNSIWGGQ